jgi:hypothetical protein
MSKVSQMILGTVFSASLLSLFASVVNATHATLRVENRSSSSIMRFYASPYWAETYTRDLLGNYTIRPGQHWYVDLSDAETNNCIYDVKVIMRNGQIFEDQINVCGQTLTIYDQ